ncbi:MAG: CRISPR-associated endonuclease Cas2 [Bryobacterales bacterium]|nr:CRISPR-associated endonuclease Cas2 [Bryobacteraceae bacterium]MDW8131910.1 CRISPR-associated endonuclease Cas2 [Bryobacterales bacterium]
MSVSQTRLYLISYDISDPRRLQRVHAFLKKHAMPVQYSVFVARVSERRLVNLLAEINRRIDPRWDDVRAYPLPERVEAVTLGRVYLPEGVMLADSMLDGLLGRGRREGELQEPGEQCDKQPESG